MDAVVVSDKDPENVRLSIRRALTGRTPASLLAYSFAIDRDRRLILLKAHFAEAPSEDDMEDTQIIEIEVDADFPDDFLTHTEIEVIAPGVAPNLLPGGVAYLRKDGPPPDHWRRRGQS